MAAPQTRQGSG